MTSEYVTLQSSMWTHLGNQTAYAALKAVSGDEALKEFKFYDGNILPSHIEDGRISASALPCLGVIAATGWGRESIHGGRRGEGDSWRKWIRLELVFVTRASEGDSTLGMGWIGDAFDILHAAFDPRAKRNDLYALMGGGDFEWTPVRRPLAGKNGPEAGAPRIWAAPWEITLRGPYRHS